MPSAKRTASACECCYSADEFITQKQQVVLFSNSPAFNSYNRQVLLVASEMYVHSMIEIVREMEMKVKSKAQNNQLLKV